MVNCDPDGVVRRAVCESNFRRLLSAEGDRRECCVVTSNEKMSSSIMRRCPDPDSAWNLIAIDVELRA